jgi:hypothetical protein
MSLNDIKLSPLVVSALYKTVLVQDPTMDKPIMIEAIKITVSEDAPEPPPRAVKKNKKIAPSTKEITEESNETIFQSLGGNQQNILIVVKYDNVKYLPDEDLEFLTSILKACKLSLEDVAIVNTNNNPGEGYKEYLKNWSSKIVLLFGVGPVSFDLPVNFPEFQVQSLTNTKFLYSPSLNECRTDKLLKSKLWVSLQRIFGL